MYEFASLWDGLVAIWTPAHGMPGDGRGEIEFHNEVQGIPWEEPEPAAEAAPRHRNQPAFGVDVAGPIRDQIARREALERTMEASEGEPDAIDRELPIPKISR